MAYLDKFHEIVGRTIMECQSIEHDIKLIYAGMLQGRWTENIVAVKDRTLGEVLRDLEKLDHSDGAPYFTQADYKLLREINHIRNWLVHRAYMDFMYEKGEGWQQRLNESYEKLLRFSTRMKTLGDEVERVRLDVMKKFGRI